MSIRWHDNANLNALNALQFTQCNDNADNATTMHDNAAELLEVKVLKHYLWCYQTLSLGAFVTCSDNLQDLSITCP